MRVEVAPHKRSHGSESLERGAPLGWLWKKLLEKRVETVDAKQMTGDSDMDDFDDDDGYEPPCMSCSGEGTVDSVSAESGRWGWDDDGPGTCPNCNGSGLRKDQKWF